MPFKPITNYKVTYGRNLEDDMNKLFSRRGSNSKGSQKPISYRKLIRKINNLEDDMFNGKYKLSKQSQKKLGKSFENVDSFIVDTQSSLNDILNEIKSKHTNYLNDIKNVSSSEKQRIMGEYYSNSKELFDEEIKSINEYLNDLFRIHKGEIEGYVSSGNYNERQTRTLSRLWNEVEKNIQKRLNNIKYQVKNLPEYKEILKYLTIYNGGKTITDKFSSKNQKRISFNSIDSETINNLNDKEFNSLKKQLSNIDVTNKETIQKLNDKIELLSKENKELKDKQEQQRTKDIISILSNKVENVEKKTPINSKSEAIKSKLNDYQNKLNKISDEDYDSEIKENFDTLYTYLKTIDDFVDRNAKNLSVDEFDNYKKQTNKLLNDIISINYQDDFIENIYPLILKFYEETNRRPLSPKEKKQINVYNITDEIFNKANDNLKFIKNVSSNNINQETFNKLFKDNHFDEMITITPDVTPKVNEFDLFKNNIRNYFFNYKEKHPDVNINIDKTAERIYDLKDEKDNKKFINAVNNKSLSQELFDKVFGSIKESNESFISFKNENHNIISYSEFSRHINEDFYNPFDELEEDIHKEKKLQKSKIYDSEPLTNSSDINNEFKVRLKDDNGSFSIYADKDFYDGEIVEICPLIILTKDCLNDKNLADKVYELDSKKGIYGLVLGYGSLYNDSTEPNLEYAYNEQKNLIYFIAKRDIKYGEELTIDYGNPWWLLTEDMWNNYAPYNDEEIEPETIEDPNSRFNPANSGQVIYGPMA